MHQLQVTDVKLLRDCINKIIGLSKAVHKRVRV